MHLTRRRFLSASAAAVLAGKVSGGSSPPPGDDAVAAGNTRFALDLYGQLKAAPGNVFFSPFSVSAALAMTAAGARGKTLDEMQAVLHLPENPHAAFGTILKSLNAEPPAGQKRGFELSVANALWAQSGYPWRDGYKTLVTKDYAAGLTDLDFQADPEVARGIINKWVEKETKDKIKDLLARGVVTADTRLVLTNAVYFKGAWQTPFKKEVTKDQPFTAADGTKTDVPLMARTGGYAYREADGVQMVALPYAGGRLDMVVILPAKPDGLTAVEKATTADTLTADLKGLRPEPTVEVYLPRFKVEQAVNLNKPLQSLGMRAAFGSADFSGMHTGAERLAISDVVHKAFVDVNEEGTEAAAATGVVVGRASAPAPAKPKVFRADRPFLFVLRDKPTDTILFAGRYAGPKA